MYFKFCKTFFVVFFYQKQKKTVEEVKLNFVLGMFVCINIIDIKSVQNRKIIQRMCYIKNLQEDK